MCPLPLEKHPKNTQFSSERVKMYDLEEGNLQPNPINNSPKWKLNRYMKSHRFEIQKHIEIVGEVCVLFNKSFKIDKNKLSD